MPPLDAVPPGAAAPAKLQRRAVGRPTAANRPRLTELLVETALRMFLADGYGATTIDRIVAKARASKSTFYARFRNKAEVFEAAIVALVARDLEVVITPRRNRDVEAMLVAVADQYLAITMSPDIAALERLLVAESCRFPHLAERVYGIATTRAVGLYKWILDAAVADGTLAGCATELVAEDLFQLTTLASLRRAVLGLEALTVTAEKQARIRYSIRLVLAGLRPAAGDAAPAANVVMRQPPPPGARSRRVPGQAEVLAVV